MSGEDRRRAWNRTWLVVGVLVFLLYLPSAFRNGFVDYDDNTFITDHPKVFTGLNLKNIAWAITSVEEYNFVPLARISHQLDCTLFGLWAPGHHLVSAVLHALNAVLLLLVLRRILPEVAKPWIPGACVLLWAIHPIHVETVAWATSRKHLLAQAFALMAMLAWLRRERASNGVERRWSTAGSAAFFTCSMLSKSSFVLLPLFLPLLGWLQERSGNGHSLRSLCRRMAAAWPLLVVAVLLVIPHVFAKNSATSAIPPPPFRDAFLHAPVAVLTLLSHVLVPVNLAYRYPFPQSVSIWLFVVVLASLVAILVVLWRRRESMPFVFAGAVMFILLAIPTSGVVPFAGLSTADRYAYAPSIGLALMLLTLALRVPAKAFFGASAVIAVCLAVATVLQTRHWKDTAALFARGEAVAPSSPLVQFHVALDRQNRGLDREAEEHLLRALNLTDSFPAASYNLACLLMDEERFGEALPHAEKAAVGRPEWAEAHLIFANALVENGRGTDALHHYEMAAKLKPSLRIAARNAEILRRRRDAN